MVDLPDDPATDTKPRAGWWFAGVFTVAATLGLWWAQLQLVTIQEQSASTFELPTLRWMIWSVTLIVVGVCFGLAVASAAGWRERIPVSGLLWGLIPLAPIASMHLWLNGLVGLPAGYSRVAVSIGTQVACSIFVGIFIAALLAPALPSPEPLRPASPGDA